MILTAWIIPRLRVTSIFGALLMVVCLAFVNSKVWDAALFFKVPDSLTVQTGLLFLTNGLIFWVLVKLLPGIEVDGIFPALAAPIVFTFSSVLIAKYGTQINWSEVFETALKWFEEARTYFQAAVQATPAPTP